MMFFIQVILGLPCPLFPSILSSSNNFWIDFALITCPKYWYFPFFIVDNNELVVFVMYKLLHWFYVLSMITFIIFLYAHMSKASV